MTDTIVPFLLTASSWAGVDGNWSTFQLNIGTPPQGFRVLPSTTGGETWVPVQDYCTQLPLANCSASRGIDFVNGTQSPGFQSNASSTWDQIGIYDLTTAENLFGSGVGGLYGLDTLSMGDGTARTVAGQMVAGISTPDFWLGSLPLGPQPSTFDVLQKDVPSLLYSLRAANLTPSVSYGLNSGAAYRSSSGGLVIGGYDRAAFTPSNISFPANYAASRSLTVSLKSLVTTNTNQGTISAQIDAGGLNMSIDSSVSQIWLPGSVCDSMAESLGLLYDPNTELYLISAANRSNLISLAPQFTFTLAANGSTNETTDIVLPYSAFDLQVGLPVYNSSTYYFPIRRAVNESQYVLGRTFLQEAYLVVNWERQNFTIGQSLHQSGISWNIALMLPPGSNGSTGSQTMNIGLIAGAVVGGIVVIGLICGGLWLRRRRNRRTEVASEETSDSYAAAGDDNGYPEDKKTAGFTELPSPPPMSEIKEMPSPDPKTEAELMGHDRYELQDSEMRHQLMSNPVFELPGHPVGSEMGGPETPNESALSPEPLRVPQSSSNTPYRPARPPG